MISNVKRGIFKNLKPVPAPSDTLDLDTLAAMDAVLGEGGSDTHSDDKGGAPTAVSPTNKATTTTQSPQKPPARAQISAPGEKAAAAAGKAVTTASSAEEDKKVRLTAVGRMGLPISAESEAKAKRASRFGYTDEAPAVASTPSTPKPVGSDADALAKRLARFGPTSSSTATAANGNGEKSQAESKLTTEDGSKMLERAKRFGLPLGTNGAGGGKAESKKEVVIGGRVVGGMVSDELLSKRAKRFANEPLTDEEVSHCYCYPFPRSLLMNWCVKRKKQARRDRFTS